MLYDYCNYVMLGSADEKHVNILLQMTLVFFFFLVDLSGIFFILT